MFQKLALAVFLCSVLGCVRNPQSITPSNTQQSQAHKPTEVTSLSLTTQVLLKAGDGTLVPVSVEIAKTPKEQEVGLMNRTELPENHGMLFIFPNAQPLSFWMKNTKIPLDIIFISEQKKIITIAKAEPCTADPCKTYDAKEPARYVLEVQQGFSEKHGVTLGSEVLF